MRNLRIDEKHEFQQEKGRDFRAGHVRGSALGPGTS